MSHTIGGQARYAFWNNLYNIWPFFYKKVKKFNIGDKVLTSKHLNKEI